MNMSDTIVAKSDQLNADDLIGREMTIKITKVAIAPGDQPVAISFEGDGGKPFKACKSMRRVLVHIWGADANQYVGRSMTLYRDPDVKFGSLTVGGIRISHMSHMTSKVTMALTATKGAKRAYVVEPLKADAGPKRQTVSEWMAALEADLGAAGTLDAVDARLSREDVLTMRQKGSEQAIARVQELGEAARGRFMVSAATTATDDGWPGPATEKEAAHV